MRNDSILVTGAAGFIASVVSKKLLDQGFSVIGVDNINDYYDVKLKKHRLQELKKHPGFQFHHLDIEDFGRIKQIFNDNDFNTVVNLAARAGVRYSIENPHVYMSTNGQGTLNLLDLMRQYDVKKMVLASSSSLYAGQDMPFKENLPVNTPLSPYAASKKAAEVMAYSYHNLFDLDISILRYFTVYGPSGRPDMSILRFIKWIDEGTPITLYGDGSQGRDFTYVDDIAEGTIKAIKNVGYEVINLGGGNNPVKMNKIIANIEALLDKKASIDHQPFHKADMHETWADISKAKTLLNWEPSVGIEEGLKRSVEWYMENRSWIKNINV